MRKFLLLTLAGLSLATTSSAHAYWLELHDSKVNAGMKDWLIHCRNRENFPYHGSHAHALVMAQKLCFELTEHEDLYYNYDASPFGNLFGHWSIYKSHLASDHPEFHQGYDHGVDAQADIDRAMLGQ